MLNRVVFPEPFGPISPAMLPRSTSIVQSLSACTPPNAFEMPAVRSSAVMTRSGWRAGGGLVGRPPLPAGPYGGQLLAHGRQDPPRQEDDHGKEQHAEDDLGHVGIGHLLLSPAEVG